jgi:hypothetical protein
MKQSRLYFIAAALFATAAALNVFNNGGVTFTTAMGSIVGAVMVWLGIKARRSET